MVSREARRQGVGRALLDGAVEWARGAGIRKLELHVFPWNTPALALYESFGFEREGYRKSHYRRDGDDVDAVLMAYPVRSTTRA
jgi:ribosomal protein S18 acetylase RimI-like enzyme